LNDVIVRLKNITKFFPGVTALRNVNLELKKGEIHGLIGENGAGKSSLIKVLTGVNRPEKGEIELEGKRVSFHNPMEAKQKGIACVYQELNIVKELPVSDNLFMGNYVKKKSGLLDYSYMNKKSTEILKTMNQDVNPHTLCGEFGMGVQQMIEIGKSILLNAKVIILDEPTSSLGEKETAELFNIVRMLKEQGLAIIFVSHKLEEVFELCDVVTVMRDAEIVVTKKSSEVTKDELVSHMVGRKMDDYYPHIDSKPEGVAIEAKNLTRFGSFEDVSFTARYGEILGFSGLVGAGRTEVCRCLFGADSLDAGEIFVRGEKVDFRQPRDAIKAGIAFVTEDRKGQGLVLAQTVSRNISLANLRTLSKVFINDKAVNRQADEAVDMLRIKTPSILSEAATLSGGNQQKVVIAKWLNSNADIFIFDEPTRGIDVGAKMEVYNVMKQLVADGKCVIMVSSELPEIVSLCHRVIVMREGRVMAQIDQGDQHFNQEDIMHAAWGGKLEDE
jgi:ribose transport system ATP-binding protein